MFLNLTEVLTNEENSVSMQAETQITELSVGGETYSGHALSPVSFVFTNTGKGKARIDAEAAFVFTAACDRCLKPVEQEITLAFGREVWAPEASTDPSVYEEQPFMDGFTLDADDLLIGEIVTSWPMKILCKPDCKGICPTCGRDLNTGTCDCDSFVPDPRMAAIKDIFEAEREV
ncbi:MAG: DUF177 domain-containing protein [bacterium]|nr:DUF177 domain-containing protein [bacterium]MCM1424693.1 DUF177 domain-containing protein [bacterium]